MRIKCNSIWQLSRCGLSKWDVINKFILNFFAEGYDDIDLENLNEE